MARPMARRSNGVQAALARLPRHFSAEAEFVPPEIAFEDWSDFTASSAYAKARALVNGGDVDQATRVVIDAFPLSNGFASIIPNKLLSETALSVTELAAVQPVIDRVLAGTKPGGDENDLLQRKTTDENRALHHNLQDFVMRNFDVLRDHQIGIPEMTAVPPPDRYDPSFEQWLVDKEAAEDAQLRHIHSVPIDEALMNMFLRSDLAPDFAAEVANIKNTYEEPINMSYGSQLHTFFSKSPGASGAATFSSSGKACEAVSWGESACPSTCAASEVIVKMLAAPISRADLEAIETAQATQDMKANSVFKKSFKMEEYVFNGGRSAAPGVAGSYGVGVVMKVGSGVSRLQAGDFVAPFKSGLGTWTTDMVAQERDLAKLPTNSAEVEPLAVLAMNAVYATELLTKFVLLKAGDTIIQNGGETSLGMLITQMAKSMGVNVINVIKPEPYYQEVHLILQGLGSAAVIDERFLDKYFTRELLDDMPSRPVLALDCVGGRGNGTNLGRALGEGGTLVIHGQKSGEPTILPSDVVDGKKLKVEGFWIEKAMADYTLEKYEAVVKEIVELARANNFAQWVERAELKDLKRGLRRAASEDLYREVVLMPQADLSAARAEAEQESQDAQLRVAQAIAPLDHARYGLNQFAEKKYLGE